MTVGDAKETARRWVAEHAGEIPGFAGAFFHGSVNWARDDDELAPTSDLDVMIVIQDPDPPVKPGKLMYRGALLEVSHMSHERVKSAEQVLGDYHLAGSIARPGVIADPTGNLAAIQREVAMSYAKRAWVRRRMEHARDNALAFLGAVTEGGALHVQVMAWLFGNGVLSHILLVAGLKNPTVRRRYLAARELLDEYGRLDLYETLLESLGCWRWTAAEAEGHLGTVAEAFDAAKRVIKTPYRFAADLTDLARPVAIDGSRELIEQGYHREAVFWMLATYSRCQWVLCHDAPADVQEYFTAGYLRLLGDLGIMHFADLKRRSEAATKLLPRVLAVAEAILAANTEVDG